MKKIVITEEQLKLLIKEQELMMVDMDKTKTKRVGGSNTNKPFPRTKRNNT